MKKKRLLDFSSIDIEDTKVEEIDLSESAMYKRAFKKFYYQHKDMQLNEDEENDCRDIEEEDEELDVEIKDEDTEIEEEDLP